MSTATSRLLELLEFLQSRPFATGSELAERLSVDRRTVRRYVTTLKELGIPVEGERGVGGGYRLRPGFRLPPLMLNDEETIVVILALAAAQRLGLGGADEASGALAKIERVLPDALRRRVEALEATLAFTAPASEGAPPAAETALLLAEAIRRRRRVHLSYRSFAGEQTARELSPYGLVVHAGRWYLAAYDHTRDDVRTFRVDRIGSASLSNVHAAPAPEGFDGAVEHVTRSLARVPWPWEVEVLLDLTPAQAKRRLPSTLAELVDEAGRTVLRMRVSSLDWTASLLAGLGCAFEIRRPEELHASVRAVAQRLLDSA
jgi:predicted DNA-binding transcriptional regulator YafY